jgi:amidohydrolase
MRHSLALTVLALTILSAAPASPSSAPDFAPSVAAHEDEAIAERRWLHTHAELSLRETRTQEWLRGQLRSIPGVEMVDGGWGTGLVAILRGGRPGPIVAYRADIDALPLTEGTGLPFACQATDTLGGRTVGVMHACGHDLHTAVLIGTARVLSEFRADMPGSVLLILEPGEEIGAGASALVAAGLFEDGRRPEAIFALHDHPTFPTGQIGFCPGRSAANVDDFFITVLGSGGHGAYPHKTIDPVVIAAEIVVALQSIVSREIDPARQAVITVGSIHGGTTSNVIPDRVELHGTVRSLEPEVREQLQTALIRTVTGIAAARGAPEPEIAYMLGTPSMYNDPALVEDTLPVLRRVVGESNVIRYEPAMGGEDFSTYQALVPGFMFRLGVGRPDRPMTIHSATFDPDERAIPIGMRLMAEILWNRLSRSAR